MEKSPIDKMNADRELKIAKIRHRFAIYVLLAILGCCISGNLYGQEEQCVTAEYTYRSPNESDNPNQVKRKAFRKAREKALADAFGSLENSETSVSVSNVDGKSSSKYYKRHESIVKAEWLKTIKETILKEPEYKDKFWECKVRVEGLARPVNTAGIDVEYHILCGGTERHHESDRFKDGERIFMRFKSPAAGFLAVYMSDDTAAYRLLPYKRQGDYIYRVEADKEYLFFDENIRYQDGEGKDKNTRLYKNDKNSESEDWDVWVVFSPNEFSKANDNKGEKLENKLEISNNLPLGNFEDWLYNCRTQDNQMCVKHSVITISK
ncbi:MAG: hypothetical protein IJ155_06480 [Prevotella sp.]|nr:hypothetical protein [Prevotella sp.]